MSNKLLIGIAIFLVAGLLVVRFTFKHGFVQFQAEIQDLERVSLIDCRQAYEDRMKLIANKKLVEQFNRVYEESKSIIQIDTTYSFLYLSDYVKYNKCLTSYFDCALNKASLDLQNDSVMANVHMYDVS